VKTEAFKLSQWGRRGIMELYSCVFRAGDLVDRVKVDRWTSKNYGGYQRFPSERRLGMARGSAVRYIIKEYGWFPTSIVINVRGKVKFSSNHDWGWCSMGTLDTGKSELWLIDGQHRIEALKRAIDRNKDYMNYPIVTSVLSLPERFDEMLLFYIINRRQRGISTDLAYRHLQRMLWQKGEDWIKDFAGKPGLDRSYAIEIVDLLNKEPVSPWYGRIRFVGDPRHEEHVVNDNHASSSILPILKDSSFKGLPIKEIAWHLLDYWNAIYRLYPECINSPSHYSMMKRPGLPALNMLFIAIYAKAKKEGKVTEDLLYRFLSRLQIDTPGHNNPEFRPALDHTFWSLESGPYIATDPKRANAKALFDNLTEKLWLSDN